MGKLSESAFAVMGMCENIILPNNRTDYWGVL